MKMFRIYGFEFDSGIYYFGATYQLILTTVFATKQTKIESERLTNEAVKMSVSGKASFGSFGGGANHS